MKNTRGLNVLYLRNIVFIFLIVISITGCSSPQLGGSSGVPTREQAVSAPGKTVSAPLETPGTNESELATLDAAVEQSGKSGPTLPAGEVAPQAPVAPTQETSTAEAQASVATAAPSTAQITPGGAVQTLSPDELATREAALERSSKPGKNTNPSCLGSLALAMFPAILGWLMWRIKRW